MPWLFLDQGELALLGNMPDRVLAKRTQAELDTVRGQMEVGGPEGVGGMAPPGLPSRSAPGLMAL